ncbi:cathepsin L-like [Limulus polyphemus]|uniref:Cathepsin L-like n=1 Tax=Limulus polyphemus TaxID=6850 RepID=A0ABM1C581_LIMPO|nr:cathepsin L-like [Limulus polyphemus]
MDTRNHCLIFISVSLCVLVGVHCNQLVGGWEDASIDDKNVKEAAGFAVKEINSRSNGLYHQKLVKIHQARRQVVSGLLFKLMVEVGSTTCNKNEVTFDDVEQCEIDENGLSQLCTVTVWVKSWIPYHELKDFECNEKLPKPSKQKTKLKIEKNTPQDINLERTMFENFIQMFQKKYNPKEKEYRFEVFQDNLKKINVLNEYEKGTAVYGVTKFSDLTVEEFKKHYLGFRPDLAHKDATPPMVKVSVVDPLPKSFDWRQKNAVTEVKNQGSCGSCWAFSTTGNIEGQWAIKKNKLVSLSEQELVDCDTVDEGCNGGLPSNAYKQIMKLGGLETEKDYPYKGVDEKCFFNRSMARVNISGSNSLPQNETELAAWLVKNGPISIGINANAMQFYFGGVSHPWKFLCNPDNLDHGVLIVGYGVSENKFFRKSTPYWIIKNSWGSSWGEQGYYRVYRGDGTCGLNKMATTAVVN